MLTSENIRQIYNQYAPRYNKLTLIEEYLFGVKRLRRRLFQNASGTVLEVAAGTGKNFPYFRSDDLTAIDLSIGMLGEARKVARNSGAEITLAVMSAENLGFADQSFDTVVSTLSTCTFPDPVMALREMSRVCKPDGRILLLEHGRSKYQRINAYLDRSAESHYRIAGCRWNQTPLDHVQKAGLRITHIKRFFFGIFYMIEIAPV